MPNLSIVGNAVNLDGNLFARDALRFRFRGDNIDVIIIQSGETLISNVNFTQFVIPSVTLSVVGDLTTWLGANAFNTTNSSSGGSGSASQIEMDAVEAGAGLNTDGTYTPNAVGTNYIGGATSLQNALELLDSQMIRRTVNLSPTSSLKGTGSAYAAAVNDLVLVDATSGNVTINLPTNPVDKSRVAVKLVLLTTGNTATINTGGTNVFNKAGGSTSAVLSLLNQAVTFQYASSTGIWHVISSDTPLSSLSGVFGTLTQQTANVANITKLLTRPSARLGSLGNRRIAGYGSRPANQAANLTDGVQTQETNRMRYVAIGNIYDLQVVFANSATINNAAITGTGDMTLTASLEYPSGTFTQLTFNNGSTSFVLHPNSKIITDVVLCDIPDTASFWIRTCVTVTSGVKWARQWSTNGASWGEGVTVGSDVTMSGTITNSTTVTFAATAILGNSNTSKATVALVGDSISAGTNDTLASPTSIFGSVSTAGIYGRSFGSAYPTLIMQISGQAISQWVSSKFRLTYLFPTCQYFMCQLGINDIRSGVSLPSVQSTIIALWEAFRAAGIYGYQTTITPNTTSTDSWATTANQTPIAQNGVRVNFNNWVRDGAPINVNTRASVAAGDASGTTVRAGDPRHPLLGYFEVADTVETSRDSGIWKAPSYTTDGLHGTSTSYPLMAAAIDTTKFLLW